MTAERDHTNSRCLSNRLQEKLNYEQEIFFRDCMRQSKSGVYAKSEEIYLKKAIMKQLKQCLSCEKEMEEYLLLMDNILEDVYRYVKDHQEEGSTENLIAHWITNLQNEIEV